MRISLNQQIFWGAALGLAGGIVLNLNGTNTPTAQILLQISEIIGGIFINLLKMIMIPLIFTSITVGIANLGSHSKMNQIWKMTLLYFFITTALASILGLFAVNIFKPGTGLKTALFQDAIARFKYEDITPIQFLKSFLSELFINPLEAMGQGKVLATVIFAVFLGIALIAVKERGRTFLDVMSALYELIMRIVDWIMRAAPLGIMALLCKLVATQDISLLSSLSKFILVVLGATLFHGLLILPAIVYLITRESPLWFFQAIKEALITAFTTSSSSATLPVTLRCATENLKVKKEIAGFVIPLGATINMDGTALYEAVAAIFVANLTGIHLNFIQQIIIFLMAMIASIGAPGIPSAGMVTMIMVLQSVGLPVEAIAILLPIDRILDTIRTAVNVEGDLAGSLIVTRLTRTDSNSSEKLYY